MLEIGKLDENEHESNDESIHKDSVTVTEFSSREPEYYTIDDSNISHAELVTKIIAADQNPQTIRGVAEPIANIKFTSIGRLSLEETVDQIDFDHTDSISDLEIISLIKKSIEDEGAKVINNSWGNPPMSKEKWKKNNRFKAFFTDDDKSYAEYVTSIKNTNNEISKALMIALDEMIKTEKINFYSYRVQAMVIFEQKRNLGTKIHRSKQRIQAILQI